MEHTPFIFNAQWMTGGTIGRPERRSRGPDLDPETVESPTDEAPGINKHPVLPDDKSGIVRGRCGMAPAKAGAEAPARPTC